MLNYQPTYHDETLDPLIQQILPDIEESLKKQLMGGLQKEAQAHFEKELAKVEQQAVEEYELAMHDLEEEGRKLFNQQTEQIKKQIEKLQRDKKNKQESQLKHLQDRFISQNFQQLILSHPKIKQIEALLAQQILQNSHQKIQQTKQRRIRQLSVKMQNKEQKLKKQREKAIRNEIYQNRSIDQLKKDIQMMRIGVASMKSQYNIKIKKIEGEIKGLRQKNKAIQPKQDIEKLRQQLQILQNRQQEFNEKILHEQQAQTKNKMRINDTFSHLDSSSEHQLPHPPTRSIQPTLHRHEPLQQEQEYSQNQSQSSSSSQSYSNQGVANPPTYHLSAEESQQNLKTFQSHVPILRLNVASLLRANWQDPLQKYVSNNQYHSNNSQYINEESDINNENDSKMGNKLSSFQEIYHQHLQKLNQATKRRKLSAQAKKTIMKNLSMMRKNRI